MTVAIDQRPRVRLWERKTYTIIDERRVPDGETPISIAQSMLRESGAVEAVATTDWHDGSRWSGFVYLDRRGFNVIHHDELKKLVEWPQFENRGASETIARSNSEVEHVTTRINDSYYKCDVCGQAGSERWAILHQFPSRT